MDSTVDRSALAIRIMPYMAILQHDLTALWRSWLVRLWLVAAFVASAVLAMGNWGKLQTAPIIASLLFPYLVFPWFLVVIFLGVTPVSGAQAETLADGILSRPVTRYGYLLAAWAARVMTVLGVYLAATVPVVVVVALAKRPVPDDHVTSYGLATMLGVVGLVLTLVVSFGFLAGTLLRKPLLAAAVLIFVWYPINFLLSTFSLEELSPISLNQAATTQLRQSWRKGDDTAEGTSEADAQAFAQQASHFLSVLSGAPVQTTKPEFFDTGEFKDFSVGRVVLGYGLPTLAAVGLAVLSFYRRDL
jgi:ABC-type transport system involved in multi-copper enzyme maturation permease subunit